MATPCMTAYKTHIQSTIYPGNYKVADLPDVVVMRVRGGGSRPTTQHRSKAGFCRRHKTEPGNREVIK